jgi:hypothetical protein
MPAQTVWRGFIVALAVFIVLASGNLVKSAEGMPLGWQRSVSLLSAKTVDRLANLFSLNRPYDWAAVRLGIQEPESDAPAPTTSTVPASPTTTALPPMRVPTAASPLRIMVAGDSTSQGVGNQLKASASKSPELSVDVKGKVATGLTRSDYFDWVARTQELITQYKPEVYMFMVGANDQQSVLTPDGKVVALYGQPGWEPAYRERVAQVMDLARGDGRRRRIRPHRCHAQRQRHRRDGDGVRDEGEGPEDIASAARGARRFDHQRRRGDDDAVVARRGGRAHPRLHVAGEELIEGLVAARRRHVLVPWDSGVRPTASRTPAGAS